MTEQYSSARHWSNEWTVRLTQTPAGISSIRAASTNPLIQLISTNQPHHLHGHYMTSFGPSQRISTATIRRKPPNQQTSKPMRISPILIQPGENTSSNNTHVHINQEIPIYTQNTQQQHTPAHHNKSPTEREHL